VNARFVKPLDEEMIISIARKTGRIITAEEHALFGGFGSAVLELLDTKGITGTKTLRIGLPDRYVEHGTQKALRQKYGLDADGMYASVKAFVEKSRLKAVAAVANFKAKDA
jgi:1-deoxy-D-xylulose-5-phosphate synthase